MPISTYPNQDSFRADAARMVADGWCAEAASPPPDSSAGTRGRRLLRCGDQLYFMTIASLQRFHARLSARPLWQVILIYSLLFPFAVYASPLVALLWVVHFAWVKWAWPGTPVAVSWVRATPKDHDPH